ncbi:CoA pyrophosphatase [Sulfuricystis multivorans]|uniref:CoA pyrophosphatase n=1 Tax=Sulfuricystis multivorans TaxID=2211108 RepID=UPI000F83C851|nr:CoA pyrophosphatase [Sulfuricystis multivorans]
MSPALSLTADWLRRRFVPSGAAPAVYTSPSPPAPVVPAAVLVPIVARVSGMTVLLTQRTAHLRDHAGQVSFPGGRCEAPDASPIATALRESREEVGIEPAQVEVLGRLPDHFTGTGFCIAPVVGLVTPPLDLRLDDFEVAEVFEVPLEFFLDAANYRRETVVIEGLRRSFWAVPWRDYYIWGATASILVSLREALSDL